MHTMPNIMLCSISINLKDITELCRKKWKWCTEYDIHTHTHTHTHTASNANKSA